MQWWSRDLCDDSVKVPENKCGKTIDMRAAENTWHMSQGRTRVPVMDTTHTTEQQEVAAQMRGLALHDIRTLTGDPCLSGPEYDSAYGTWGMTLPCGTRFAHADEDRVLSDALAYVRGES